MNTGLSLLALAALPCSLIFGQATGSGQPAGTPGDAPANSTVVAPADTMKGEPKSDDTTLVTDPDAWKFRLTPFFWVPGMNGHMTVKGNNVPVDLSVGDAFSAIDDLKFGLMFQLEAEHGKFTLFGNVTYVNLESHNDDEVHGNIDTGVKEGIFEVGGAYRVIDTPVNGDEHMRFRLEPLAGARIWYLDGSLTLTDLGFEGSDSMAWVDAFGGARAVFSFNDSISIGARADFGGGMSEFTWQALAHADWRLTSWGTLAIGWRWLSDDYHDGNGSDAFVYDILMQGPFIAFQFNF